MVNVSIEYCLPIELGEASLWYMLKRLAEYEPGHRKRSHDAMKSGDKVLCGLLRKRAAQGVVVLRDSAEYVEDDVYKEVEHPTPLERRFHYNPKLGEREFDLEYNFPELLSEAFEDAAAKVLGDSAHDITLRFVTGGAYGDASDGAKERALFMICKRPAIVTPGETLDVGQGAVNVPWGIASMTVPETPSGVADRMRRLLAAFGLKAEGEPAWRVITVADGG